MFFYKNRGLVLLFVLIILSLLSLSISTCIITNNIHKLHSINEMLEQESRSGAVFALKLALAQLQQFAGKDNVISLKADNFSELTFPNNTCKNTVGLWEVNKINDQYTYQFKCWLNSDYNSNNFHNILSINELDTACLSKNEQYTIDVSKRKIYFPDKNQSIKWCFFIEDESQKIDLSLVDLNEVSNEETLSYFCPQYPNLEGITIFSKHQHNNLLYKYLNFLEEIKLIDDIFSQKVIDNQHLCTLHTYGIWSKLLGLKKEINHFLSERNFCNNETIFESNPKCLIQPPNWKFLQSFAKCAENRIKNSIKVQPSFPFCRPQYSQDYSSSTSLNDICMPTQHGINPIITQVLFNISCYVQNNKLIIKISPQVALWNPYNITLQQTNYKLVTNIFAPQKSDKICLTILGKSKDSNKHNLIQHIQLCSNTVKNYLNAFWTLSLSTAFEPGAVKIFSLDHDYYADSADQFNGNAALGATDYSFIINTNINANEYSDITFSFTDSNGSQNRNWNSFYVQLLSQDILCQEVAQISQTTKLPELKTKYSSFNTEQILFSFSAYMKTSNPHDATDNTGIRWLTFANPRAPYVNRSVFQDPTSAFFNRDNIAGNWSWNVTFQSKKTTLNIDQLTFLHNLVLFDLPHKKYSIANLVTLRHVNWTPFGYLPTYTFANSNANPYLNINETFTYNVSNGQWPTHAKVEALFDYTYLLNETLFDNFFCVPTNNSGHYVYNQRIKQLCFGQNISAENSLIKGVFNVHSNATETWIAYLSTIQDNDHSIIFPRISCQENTKYPCQKITVQQVQILAKNIVKLIKLRKHFATLSNFINRSIHENNMQQHGLLQQAINDARLNEKYQKQFITFHKNKKWFNDKIASGYLEDGLPHIIDQADILQTISHFMTTRGDTFKITAYGEADHNGQKKIHKCEAIVQRFPEFVNPNDNFPNDENLSEMNRTLGRRFKIILFRWCD